jgi:hypothetical protein
MTRDQLDPSAHAPCTRTMFRMDGICLGCADSRLDAAMASAAANIDNTLRILVETLITSAIHD